jgi:hypothetical protein
LAGVEACVAEVVEEFFDVFAIAIGGVLREAAF